MNAIVKWGAPTPWFNGRGSTRLARLDGRWAAVGGATGSWRLQCWWKRGEPELTRMFDTLEAALKAGTRWLLEPASKARKAAAKTQPRGGGRGRGARRGR